MADVIGVCAGDDLAPAPVVRKLELGVVAPGVENTPYGDDGTEPPNMPTVGADDPPIPCKVPLADVYGERGGRPPAEAAPDCEAAAKCDRVGGVVGRGGSAADTDDAADDEEEEEEEEEEDVMGVPMTSVCRWLLPRTQRSSRNSTFFMADC